MRFKVAGVHREFFEKNGYLELENVLTTHDIENLASLSDQLVEKRLSHPIPYQSAQELYKAGRDLWREELSLSKTITSHKLAEIGADLLKKNTLLLAFDQLFRTGSTPGYPQQVPSTLNEFSSIAPLAGAVLIHLQGKRTPSSFIPHQHENVMYLSPHQLIPWELFFQLPHQSYLLIAYALPDSLYVLQKKDPHTHALKKFGYVFGDKLHAPEHPIVYRKN